MLTSSVRQSKSHTDYRQRLVTDFPPSYRPCRFWQVHNYRSLDLQMWWYR